jgi:hypothetical protein
MVCKDRGAVKANTENTYAEIPLSTFFLVSGKMRLLTPYDLS